jgi:SAM-dependent methyltransferase
MNYFNKRYDKQSVNLNEAKYDFWKYGDRIGKILDDIEVNFVLNFIHEQTKVRKYKKLKIIDIGCSTGYHLIAIYKIIKEFNLFEEYSFLGLDTNKNYISQSCANIKKELTEKDQKNFLFSHKDYKGIEDAQNTNDEDCLNIYLFLGVVQFLSFNEIKAFSNKAVSICKESFVLIKHPLNFSKEKIIENKRENCDYNSNYKNFEELFYPFSENFDFVNMEKCYKKSQFQSNKDYEKSFSKENTKLVFVTLKSL